MKLTVRNKEMYIIDEGEGPALVFLHGSPLLRGACGLINWIILNCLTG
ncbi:hypothetical protein P7H25_24755 [Paenibacillus larvae]|nr:hypothetical protein [Paenibacillus larvae]MDT2258099.1 hypothetical protein [Paenibacillus larvae]